MTQVLTSFLFQMALDLGTIIVCSIVAFAVAIFVRKLLGSSSSTPVTTTLKPIKKVCAFYFDEFVHLSEMNQVEAKEPEGDK